MSNSARRARLLIVDDEIMFHKALRRTLGAEYEVSVATSAREALEAIARESFDVMLSDLMMPEMNGMELYDEIVRLAPALARRVIFLSGGAFTEGSRAFLERIENPVLDKPFQLAVLKSTLAAVIARG